MSIKSKKGFTIIEVVLVLAIAGLIFLMVFIALPNMQRSQRDTQRRNDYSALSANMTQYITNNNGKLPTIATLNASKYINESGTDPDGYNYYIRVATCNANDASTNTNVLGVSAKCNGASALGRPNDMGNDAEGSWVYVVRYAKCDSGYLKASTSTRAFAIYGFLETGEGTYCQSNS